MDRFLSGLPLYEPVVDYNIDAVYERVSPLFDSKSTPRVGTPLCPQKRPLEAPLMEVLGAVSPDQCHPRQLFDTPSEFTTSYEDRGGSVSGAAQLAYPLSPLDKMRSLIGFGLHLLYHHTPPGD